MMDSLLLYKILKNRTGAEISASGNPAIMSDTLKNNPMNEMKVFGWSKQERTTGANLIDVNSMLNDCLIKNEDGTYSIKKTEDDRFSKAFPVNLKAGTAVRFDADIIEYNGAYNKPLQISFFNYQTIAAGQAIVLNSDVTEAAIYQDSKNNHGTYTKFKNAILNIGDIQIPYEPYTGGQPSPSPDYPQEIVSAGMKWSAGTKTTNYESYDGGVPKLYGDKVNVEVCGKKWLHITPFRTKIKNGVTFEYVKPGGIKVTGTATANTDSPVFPIELEPGDYYTDRIAKSAVVVERNGKAIWLGGKNFKILQNDVPKYWYFPVLQGDTVNATIYPRICKKEEVPQSLSISTPTGLPAIPVDTDGNYTDADGQQWIADYVDLKRGKYVQNICKLPLKNLVKKWYTWGVNNLKGNITGFYAYLADAGYQESKGMKVLTNICRYHRDVWGGANIGCNINYSNQYLEMSLPTDILEDTSTNEKAIKSFAKIIEQTDAYVMYVLADPIERDLTPEEIQAYKNLVTYAGTTIVENDAECYMEVSAGGGDSLRAKKLALILGE